MINSIPSTISTVSASSGQSAAKAVEPQKGSAEVQQATVKQVATIDRSEEAAAVTVELSEAAQAKQLKTEGYSIADISTKLGLDKATVSSYVNVEA